MFEIGTTLREARVRRKLTLQQVEEDTKIRVKYLQAMENEDFDVMPSPAYVKGFLQTYAAYLGLDPAIILDEYRSRGEPREEHHAVRRLFGDRQALTATAAATRSPSSPSPACSSSPCSTSSGSAATTRRTAGPGPPTRGCLAVALSQPSATPKPSPSPSDAAAANVVRRDRRRRAPPGSRYAAATRTARCSIDGTLTPAQPSSSARTTVRSCASASRTVLAVGVGGSSCRRSRASPPLLVTVADGELLQGPAT